MKKRNPTTIVLAGALALGGLAGTGATIDGLRQAQHEREVTAQADAVTTISQAQSAERAGMAADAQEWIDEQIAEATKALDEAIASAEKTLADTKGKVADDEVRTTLTDAIDAATKQTTIPGIEGSTSKVTKATEKVAESHEDWKKAEAERKAAEEAAKKKVAEEAAARRAAAAASSQTSSPSRATHGTSKSTSTKPAPSKSGSSSAPAKPKPKPKPAGGSYKAKIAGLLSTYGCSGAGISIDDPRLNAGANGTADWYNNTVFIRSGLTTRLTYVVAHECVHLKQYRIYGGDVGALQADMNRIYGGSGFSGLDQNADCVTRRWGISQYHYTASCGGARGKAAAAIAAGHKP